MWVLVGLISKSVFFPLYPIGPQYTAQSSFPWRYSINAVRINWLGESSRKQSWDYQGFVVLSVECSFPGCKWRRKHWHGPSGPRGGWEHQSQDLLSIPTSWEFSYLRVWRWHHVIVRMLMRSWWTLTEPSLKLLDAQSPLRGNFGWNCLEEGPIKIF